MNIDTQKQKNAPLKINFQRCVLSLLLSLALVLCCAPVLAFLSFPAKAAEVVSTGSCGDDLTYTLTDDGVLTISGTGAMTDFSVGGAPWYADRTSITSVVIEDGVTSIGTYAFYLCSKLVDAVVADTVQTIGMYAFYNCSVLKSVNLPDGITSIPDYCFYDCAFQSIDIPNSVTSIGARSFYYCDFTTVVIPENVTTIGERAFYYCDYLTDVTFLSNVPPAFGTSVFRNNNFGAKLWVPVGSLETYETAANMSDFSMFFIEIGAEAHFKEIPLSDYLVSSSQDSSSLVRKYGVYDGYYVVMSGANYYASFIDGFANSSHSDNLAWYESAFYVGDIVEDALSFSLSGSLTYVATGTSTYTGARELHIAYYDADGTLLSSERFGYVYGSKFTSGTVTFTFTGAPTFPDGAEYITLYMCIGSMSGMTVSDITFNFELTASYEPIIPPVNPTIGVNLSPAYSYTIGDTVAQMSITASVTDDGILSYQWYENTTNSTTGGTPISGATSSSYTPSISDLGTKYYYCAVTNTLGELSATVYSNVTAVTVSAPGAPVITTDLPSIVYYDRQAPAAPLTIQATLTSTGTLSYQWYGCVYGYGWPELIAGATSSSYTPPTDLSGEYKYYCVVTNTSQGYTTTTKSAECYVFVGGQFSPDTFNIYNYKNYITSFGGGGSYDILTVKFPTANIFTDIHYRGTSQSYIRGDAWIYAYSGEYSDYTVAYDIYVYPMGRGGEMVNVLNLDNIPSGTIADFSFAGHFESDCYWTSAQLHLIWFDADYNKLEVTEIDAADLSARYVFAAPDGAAYMAYRWLLSGVEPEEFMPITFYVDDATTVFTVAASSGASDEAIEDLQDEIGSLGEKVDEIGDKLDEMQQTNLTWYEKLWELISDGFDRLEDAINGVFSADGEAIGEVTDKLDDKNEQLGDTMDEYKESQDAIPTVPKDVSGLVNSDDVTVSVEVMTEFFDWEASGLALMFVPMAMTLGVAALCYFVFGKKG